MIEFIRKLDLDYLQAKLVKNKGWDLEKAREAVRKYKNFLILKYKYPNQVFVPTNDIDEVFHAHILHTKKYIRDCEIIFGKYIHHDPSEGHQSEDELQKGKEVFLQTADLYYREFHESYSLEIERAIFWGF